MANKTISDLRELSTVSNNNVLVVETNNETFKVTKENLLKEVNTQLNTKSNVNHTHDEYVTESELNAKGLATESFVGSEISKIELTPGPQGPKGDKGDPGTTTWEGITNKPTNLATETFVTQKIAEASLSGGESSNVLNKIEILENDPVSDDLFEGRIWIVVNNNVSAPVISLYSYAHDSIIIKLDEASYNSVYGNIATYELYNNDVLLESEVINVSKGGTYKINNLTPETTYNIKLKGVLNNNKSEFSNTITATTKSVPQTEDLPSNGLVVFLKGSDFTNSPKTTTLYDLSGNNNNGNVSGFNYTFQSGSDENGNIVFDGSNDKIVIPQSESISATNGFTIAFKGSINDLSQKDKEVVDMFISEGGPTTGAQISLIYGYANNTFELYGNSLPFRERSQITINDTDIHTIIYTYDGVTLCGYLDGVKVVNASKSVSIKLPIKSTSIGANSRDSSFIKIKLRYYLFYNRGLTADEVAIIENGLL